MIGEDRSHPRAFRKLEVTPTPTLQTRHRRVNQAPQIDRIIACANRLHDLVLITSIGLPATSRTGAADILYSAACTFFMRPALQQLLQELAGIGALRP